MYCIGCGAENTEGSARCIRCGHDLATLRTDTYTRPAVDPSSPVLWNPDVAALLSIPFSPVFGAVVHALNWHRLGLRRRAAFAWLWALSIFLTFVAVGIYGEVARVSERTIDGYTKLTQLSTLILWYFCAARAQGKYITGTLRNEYFREGWVIPVCAATVFIGLLFGLSGALR